MHFFVQKTTTPLTIPFHYPMDLQKDNDQLTRAREKIDILKHRINVTGPVSVVTSATRVIEYA